VKKQQRERIEMSEYGLISVCADCEEEGKITLIGCHVENRYPQKLYCWRGDCTHKCPKTNGEYSHGLCPACAEKFLAENRRRREKEKLID